jgi:quaternary ammonium compound-resistance protein SugE
VQQPGPCFLNWLQAQSHSMKTLGLYALAAALYVAGGLFMKYSHGLTKWLPTVALVGFFAAGALLQAWAMKQEALGPSYVVVLGLEALLAVIAGNVIFGEPISAKLFGGIFLVIAGITLLRLN